MTGPVTAVLLGIEIVSVLAVAAFLGWSAWPVMALGGAVRCALWAGMVVAIRHHAAKAKAEAAEQSRRAVSALADAIKGTTIPRPGQPALRLVRDPSRRRAKNPPPPASDDKDPA